MSAGVATTRADHKPSMPRQSCQHTAANSPPPPPPLLPLISMTTCESIHESLMVESVGGQSRKHKKQKTQTITTTKNNNNNNR
jgi:hypothetical protein